MLYASISAHMGTRRLLRFRPHVLFSGIDTLQRGVDRQAQRQGQG